MKTGLPGAHDIRQCLRENGHIRLAELHKHWHILREPTDRAPFLPLPVLDPLLGWQVGWRPRGALNRPGLPPRVVIVSPPPTEANDASPLIRNKRGRFRAGTAQQGLPIQRIEILEIQEPTKASSAKR